MEWKSNLRRAQSLSGSLSCDQPTWTEAGQRDKTKSVSQLVARYQSTAKVRASIQETLVNDGEPKPKQVLKEISPSLESKESHLESLMWRNEEREWPRAKTNLVRSKSMGSLQNSTGSIEVLKALFEPKAAMQNMVKSNLRGVNFPSSYKAADIMQVMKGDAEEVKSLTEKPKIQIPADASVNEEKDDHPFWRVVKQKRMERRKTIGGIDFERITAAQADDTRRSFADFRDSSFIQTKEKLCVSVKAISALYLSKVAPQESKNRLLKPVQDQSSESGKRVKLPKMAEDSHQRKGDLPPYSSSRNQPGPEDISGTHFQQSVPSQFSKEKLYHQRQRCELRRLLKHTHPELKTLDDVVDEELAEVLSSETVVTTGETGYEGEVLSRRLIFENFDKVSPYVAKRHMAEGIVERGDASTTTAVFKEHKKRQCTDSVKEIVEDEEILGSSQVPNTECEEEMMRIDVQATRRIFESRSENTYRQHPKDKLQGDVTFSGDGIGAGQHQKQEFRKESLHRENKSNTCAKCLDMTDLPHKQGSCTHVLGQSPDNEFSGREEVLGGETDFEDQTTSLSDSERSREIIKTRAGLLQNNPFIPINIEREQPFEHTSKSHCPAGNSGKTQDDLKANVKNRTHLFESMPFDKIRHQNRDEVETMVENMKETLHSLYNVKAIHSGGSIIEVNETMIAKKAKFTLSEGGPQIKYEEMAEGGAQNFILQLLPRANLKPQIIYLKEDNKGGTKATVVNVPVHQHLFSINQDTEFKTANVIQVVEDILSQDNSLRKGVIIQETVDQCPEVLVYSLYNYFDEEDVKSYCPPQDTELDEPEPKRDFASKRDNQELRKGAVESTISCLTSKDQTYQGTIRPEITVKGNVKLFKSCIEKGDLEYLKNLQAEPTVQEELSPNQNVAGKGLEHHHEQEGDQTEATITEWVPVDVKKLKNIFSGAQGSTQPKQNARENLAQSTTISCEISDQTVPLGKSQSFTECNVGVLSDGQPKNTLRECVAQTQKEKCNSTAVPQGSYLHLDTQNDDRVHKAELVEAMDDNDEIFKLQTAIHNLRQATMEAKSLHLSSQEKHLFLVQESSNEPDVSVTTTQAELPQENWDQKDDPCIQPRRDEFQISVSNITPRHKSDHQHKSIKICHRNTNSEEIETKEACTKSSETTTAQREDEEVVFQGKLQAALNSLQKSNINVTRGDFRAAMIYRHSSKPHKERSQKVDVSIQKPTTEKFCPLTELKSNQAILRQDVSNVNVDPPSQIEILNKDDTDAVLKKDKRPVGLKPAIPPKPEHLKVTHRGSHSTNAKNPELTQTDIVKLEKTVPQPLPMASISLKDERKPDMLKVYRNANSAPDSVDLQRNELFDEAIVMSQENEERHQVPGSVFTLEADNTDKNMINCQQEINVPIDEKSPQDFSAIEAMNQTDGSHDFHDERQKLGGKKAFSAKNAPMKPKRVKIAQSDNKNPTHMSGDNNSSTLTGPSRNEPNTCGQNTDSKEKHKKEIKQDSKVDMREKKGRIETEDERRQRLSVHMDEIMRGNMTAAMEIFDNLRKQEELQSILSKVEQIEQDTSKVDVRSLRGVFENVPDWAVNSDKKKQKKEKGENKEEKMPLTRDNTESKSSMAHVFGDLERASEEIMNLKEQTLARLLDIEGAIKKALYSVSTLKSDSDIDGLSYLFRESLGTVQPSPSTGNISKISIGSSRKKSVQTQESPAVQENTGLSVSQGASMEIASATQRASPPSSLAFISIQSAARKTGKTEVLPPETKLCPTCQHSPKTEGKFRTMKTLTCSSPVQNRKIDPRNEGQRQFSYNLRNPKRELDVETDGNSTKGPKKVTENYERTDYFGNRFYSSKTSTVINAQPQTTSTAQPVVSPTTCHVTNYPEVRLPINQKP